MITPNKYDIILFLLLTCQQTWNKKSI